MMCTFIEQLILALRQYFYVRVYTCKTIIHKYFKIVYEIMTTPISNLLLSVAYE